jgi:hypothetical protein
MLYFKFFIKNIYNVKMEFTKNINILIENINESEVSHKP